MVDMDCKVGTLRHFPVLETCRINGTAVPLRWVYIFEERIQSFQHSDYSNPEAATNFLIEIMDQDVDYGDEKRSHPYLRTGMSCALMVEKRSSQR